MQKSCWFSAASTLVTVIVASYLPCVVGEAHGERQRCKGGDVLREGQGSPSKGIR